MKEVSCFRRSLELVTQAERVIPGGLLGFHRLMAPEEFPSFCVKAEGAYLEDVDGRRYVDLILGKGAVILGYRHPVVHRAVAEQLERGNQMSLTPALIVSVAEALLALFPGAEQVRLHKTGSDACASAARLARVHTGRDLILGAGYHGWHDWCSPDEPGAPGGASYIDFDYDLDLLETLLSKHRGRVAAVFLEPQPAFLEPGFYREAFELARHGDALVILDEVKTGGRVAAGSMQAALGVRADLTTVSKAIANGFCISAVLSRKDILASSRRTHISSTFDVEAIPLAAASATLAVLASSDALSRVDAIGRALVAGLEQVFCELDVAAKAFGPGSSFRIGFREPERELQFYGAMAREHVLLYPHDNSFVSLAHGPHELQLVIDAARTVLSASAKAMPRSVGRAEVESFALHQFPSRKGFLRGCPGPRGRHGQ